MAKKKKEKTPLRPEIKGLYLLSFTLVGFISLISFGISQKSENLLGFLGFSLGYCLNAVFGLSSFLLLAFPAWIGFRNLFKKPVNSLKLKTVYVTLIVVSTSFLLSLIENDYPVFSQKLRSFFYPAHGFHLGGSVFYYLYRDIPLFNLSRSINSLGVFLLFSATWMTGFMLLFKVTPLELYHFAKAFFKWPELKKTEPEVSFATPVKKEPKIFTETEILPQPKPVKVKVLKEKEPKEKEKEEVHIKAPPQKLGFGNYKLPSPDLLTNPKKVDQSSLKINLKRQAEILEETLLSFGIEAKVGQINCGPTITSFEVHPAVGVKVQKIKALEDDIALNMEAKTIRIIAPIPGKAAVGIEVPNPQPQEVSFKEMLVHYMQGTTKYKIPILLGKAVNGDYVMSDLTKMPHCIIAGATGSGKSVCINTIVMSIVMNASPDQIKLVMVDPKKVELTPYTRLPHMLAPVITEPKEACLALNWLVKEMERRYELMKLMGTRNIEAFNNRTPDINFEKNLAESLDIEIPVHMPYIVGIIDELADLMMVSASDIETPIARIAQMARAVGIHLILATQRPSREVITGLIKANFPTRISFKVASRINSQIVLDEVGAESLLGNGDMLFLPPGTSHVIRAQGAFIRDEDINSIIKASENERAPNYIISSFENFSPAESDAGDPGDELFNQAQELVLSTGTASTTFLQRKLKIGYARAASLIDLLEARGVVGPQDGARSRKVLKGRKMGSELGDFE